MRTMLVIPVYNEEHRLDLQAFAEALARDQDLEFLFVDDGSRDRSADLITDFIAQSAGTRLTLLRLSKNRGKAEAVRQGLQHALAKSPEAVGFWDADLATPLTAIADFIDVLAGQPDIDFVIGSRVKLLGRDIQRHSWRHYLGRVFATLASLSLNLPVYDTQCGAKLMRVLPKTSELFKTPFLSRWIFDVELIARYLQLQQRCRGTAGHGIYELPLAKWHDIKGSKVTPAVYLRSGLDLVRIHRRYKL